MRSPSQGPYSRDFSWVAPTVALLLIVAGGVLGIYRIVVGADDCRDSDSPVACEPSPYSGAGEGW